MIDKVGVVLQSVQINLADVRTQLDRAREFASTEEPHDAVLNDRIDRACLLCQELIGVTRHAAALIGPCHVVDA